MITVLASVTAGASSSTRYGTAQGPEPAGHAYQTRLRAIPDRAVAAGRGGRAPDRRCRPVSRPPPGAGATRTPRRPPPSTPAPPGGRAAARPPWRADAPARRG